MRKSCNLGHEEIDSDEESVSADELAAFVDRGPSAKIKQVSDHFLHLDPADRDSPAAQTAAVQLIKAEYERWEREHFQMERLNLLRARRLALSDALPYPLEQNAGHVARLSGGKYDRAEWMYALYLRGVADARRRARAGGDLSDLPKPDKAVAAQIRKLWPDMERAIEFAVSADVSSIQREQRIYAFVHCGSTHAFTATLELLHRRMKTASAKLAAEAVRRETRKRDGSVGRDANVAKGAATRALVKTEVARYRTRGVQIGIDERKAIAVKLGISERHVRRVIEQFADDN
ncbi:hypothetical protein [Burkholderia cenocepacia]|uniref:hypothetical protein n=1 Tax=Burkholderia cenocepacia TaxID=95486 RepID=UPI0019C73A06|nr:hypothetical protein [Burkholderia cenocepacia]CAB5082095.1 hypothetical protein IST4129_00068 [Burkholderia cenocepacia]CAB5082678.1 hypothetical protein IST439_00100 [Burkholderia cenocepacia]CAB5087427.1 hypothetical protein IST4134_00068 [Burkholderia cenocepacia]CAB5087428.1 hypothetical protein IST4116A_00068 [Burkholderia cenocepacia]CAB5087656.1 hypothetical protein IST4110_00068 [Burkholderia cenocepacia]